MLLYDYWRSSASYRLRIALNLKGLSYDQLSVHLVKDGGEQHKAAYKEKNPQGLVPSLELDDGTILTQSIAIIEYLEESFPKPALLPDNALDRAHARSLAQLISADIHPVNNLRILQYLTKEFGADEEAKANWYRHWIYKGFDALEERLGDGPYCCGLQVTIADLCLIPQVYNAMRFNCDLTPYPKIRAVHEACQKLEAFERATPENQPDALQAP